MRSITWKWIRSMVTDGTNFDYMWSESEDLPDFRVLSLDPKLSLLLLIDLWVFDIAENIKKRNIVTQWCHWMLIPSEKSNVWGIQWPWPPPDLHFSFSLHSYTGDACRNDGRKLIISTVLLQCINAIRVLTKAKLWPHSQIICVSLAVTVILNMKFTFKWG